MEQFSLGLHGRRRRQAFIELMEMFIVRFTPTVSRNTGDKHVYDDIGHSLHIIKHSLVRVSYLPVVLFRAALIIGA